MAGSDDSDLSSKERDERTIRCWAYPLRIRGGDNDCRRVSNEHFLGRGQFSELDIGTVVLNIIQKEGVELCYVGRGSVLVCN